MVISKGSALPAHVRLGEQGEHRQRQSVEGKCFRLHGEFHDFADLVQLYGQSFLTRVLDSLVLTYRNANPSTAGKRIQSVRLFLRYLAHAAARSDSKSKLVYDRLVSDSPTLVEKRAFDEVVEEYASHLRDLNSQTVTSSSAWTTRRSLLEATSAALQDVAPELGWPQIEPIKGIRASLLNKGNNVATLGELTRAGETVQIDKVLELSARRLARLRAIMESILIKEKSKFDLGQSLLLDDIVPLETIFEAIDHIRQDYGKENCSELHPDVERCFPVRSARALSSLLRYIVAKHDGVFVLKWLPIKLQYVVATFGGTRNIPGYLQASVTALVASYVIVMVDTGYNIQPIDDLAASAFDKRPKGGVLHAATRKRRANDKRVDVPFEIASEEHKLAIPAHSPGSKVSSWNAVQMWLEMSEPARRRAVIAGSNCAKYVWILRNGHAPKSVRRYTPGQFKSAFKEILDGHSDDPEIGGLAIQRRMVRKTQIQLTDLRHAGDLKTASFLAGHSATSTTSNFYLNGAHLKVLLESRIREFQNLWEASFIADNLEFGKRLSISPIELSSRQKRAVETGLGVQCLDPNAGVQPDTAGITCTKVEQCATCPMMRFTPNSKSIRDLVLVKKSLTKYQDEFAGVNPLRWARVWLPLLALVTAIYEKLSSGPKGVAVRDAEKKVSEQLAGGEIVLFQPW